MARLATVRSDGTPRIVPIVFAVARDAIVSAVDHKPKSTRDLARLADIAHEPRVTLLVDDYDDDWTRLWWVRVDGIATVLERDFDESIDALVAKYPQYRDVRPEGPVIEITIGGLVGWSSGEGLRPKA